MVYLMLLTAWPFLSVALLHEYSILAVVVISITVEIIALPVFLILRKEALTAK